MANLTLGGPASLAFKDFEISSQYLGEVTVNLEDGERERTTLAGTFSANSGTIENAEATVTIYAPSMDWLGDNLLKGRYNDGEPTGNIVANVNNCSSDIGPMNIHFECEGNDANDVHFYNASLRANIEATYNESDFIEVELVFHANPDEDGNVWRLGTGDLTQESEWDVETEETVPVTS